MRLLLLFTILFVSNYISAQYTTVDLGNVNSNTTLFLHSGNSSPVPFNLRKTGYSGNSINYGLLTLDMGHNTPGGGSNLHFRLKNSANSYKEYGGLGAYIQDNTSGSEDGALTFYTTYNGVPRTRRMTLLNNGNLGIGINNPVAKLHLNSLERTAFRIYRETSATKYLSIWHGTSGAVIEPIRTDGGTSLLYLGGYDNPTNIILSANGGNVGIGTTTPDEKFHVNGTATITGNIGNVIGPHWQTGKHTLELQNSDAGDVVLSFHRAGHTNAAIKHPSSGGIAFSATGGHNQTHMHLKPNGNVGIGTTTPDAKLTVKGKIHTQEVKVDLAGAVAPDYVFLENYNLKTIEEVASHIQEKGHLPNIPSAKKMAEEGINLKEMNLKLLEKIEELTLYTIKQEKQLQSQHKQLQSQETINQELETRLAKIEALLNKE